MSVLAWEPIRVDKVTRVVKHHCVRVIAALALNEGHSVARVIADIAGNERAVLLQHLLLFLLEMWVAICNVYYFSRLIE